MNRPNARTPLRRAAAAAAVGLLLTPASALAGDPSTGGQRTLTTQTQSQPASPTPPGPSSHAATPPQPTTQGTNSSSGHRAPQSTSGTAGASTTASPNLGTSGQGSTQRRATRSSTSTQSTGTAGGASTGAAAHGSGTRHRRATAPPGALAAGANPSLGARSASSRGTSPPAAPALTDPLAVPSQLFAQPTASTGPGVETATPHHGSSGLKGVVDHIPDWSRPIIALLAALALTMWIRSLLAGSRVRRLSRQQRKLVVDLGVLQAALVPDVPDRLGPLEASVAYRPADGPAAGGDFYDAFVLPDKRIGFVVGDASGHGREAIARATSVRYTIRAYMEIALEPREALRTAGRVLADDSPDGSFATAVLAVYDPVAGTLTYACAGHPPPIVLAPDPMEPVIACASPPIGWDLPTGQRQTTIPLGPCSTVCLYTDGLAEARREGAMLGTSTIVDVVRGLPEGADASVVLRSVGEMADDSRDDMAALLVRVTGDGVPVMPGPIEELELTRADVAGGRPELFLEACGLDAGAILLAVTEIRGAVAEHDDVIVRVNRGDGSVSVSAREERRRTVLL